MMFFEGSEKKVEVITAPEAGSLRALGRDFWNGIVARANAEILDVLSNEHCDAYLLSESSLFVWHDRFLMLTCGTTTLADAFLHFLAHINDNDILYASFQRKNEYLSHLQKSSFADDLARIGQRLPGSAYRLGKLDSHHHYIFHLDRPYQCMDGDVTNELLMYHIKGDGADYLRSPDQTPEGVRSLLQLDKILPGFAISDWLFEPFGYSMNAIKGDRYATFHITPQEESSYVSFETNLELDNSILVATLLGALQPGSWDLIGFNARDIFPDYGDYHCMTESTLDMSCGFAMNFRHFQHQDHRIVQPEMISRKVS